MEIASKFIIALIALEHLYILYFEMFAWETRGKKVFRGILPKDLFEPTKVLAANLGLYNGFLAAGLIWTFWITDPEWNTHISIFFLGCVMVAGIIGGVTASRKIFYLQALPAIVGLLVVFLR